jgi:hypothetical protein
MNYWDVHGWWFLFFMLFFPRLTMLFMGQCFVTYLHPILFWCGWLVAPRLVGAILATTYYWATNPTLVVMAWIFALGGTGSEGPLIKRRK